MRSDVGSDEFLRVEPFCLVLLIGFFWLPAAIGAAWLDHSRCGGWLRCAMPVDSICISLIAGPAADAPVADPWREVSRFRFRPALRVLLPAIGSRIRGRFRYCRTAFPAG